MIMHLFIIFLLHVRVLPTICTTCDIYKFIMLEKICKHICVHFVVFLGAFVLFVRQSIDIVTDRQFVVNKCHKVACVEGVR